MRFTVLSKPLVLRQHHLKATSLMYPYDLWQYKDLAAAAKPFLAENFSVWKPYMEVVAITNHNGWGRQWGIIVLHYPYSGTEWLVVAQFGHRFSSLRRNIIFAKWLSRYFQQENRAFEQPHTLQSLTSPA